MHLEERTCRRMKGRVVKQRGVRVVAGRARGRRLAVPPGRDVRPTKDIVREAVFSALQARDAVADANVLDLYAGSGALGIEALSRGARHATFVDSAGPAVAAIEQNLANLGLDDAGRVVRVRAGTYLDAARPNHAPFDLVFADPPYDVGDGEVTATLASLAAGSWCAPDATVVLERPAWASVTVPRGLESTWERTFGDTLVVFLVH
jgi:16S rRNA (guanine966-N2)-methyltransferase